MRVPYLTCDTSVLHHSIPYYLIHFPNGPGTLRPRIATIFLTYEGVEVRGWADRVRSVVACCPLMSLPHVALRNGEATVIRLTYRP